VPVKPADGDLSRKLTKEEKAALSLSEKQKEILVGLLLGDLYAHIVGRCVNVKLTFRQGIVHEEYLSHLYDLFSNFCPQGPKIQNSLPDIRTGKVYSAIYFLTYSLPCFNDIYKLFYLNGKKKIPANIGQLLTPLSLCYWIADDGSWNKSKRYVVLCTNSFTLEEVNRVGHKVMAPYGGHDWRPTHPLLRGRATTIVLKHDPALRGVF